MSLNTVPAAERVHIAFFGCRNAGKSSLVNAITNQNLSIVSAIKGTTTDPVQKSMELLPLGPVVIIDTPGLDDEGELGSLRIAKTWEVLNRTDLAVLVLEAGKERAVQEAELLDLLKKRKIPFLLVYTKLDLHPDFKLDWEPESDRALAVSGLTGQGIEELKNRLASLLAARINSRQLVGDLIQSGDLVILVVPIDKAAPQGRLILPQQQTIRDILENGAQALVTRESEYAQLLARLPITPALVITDSQVFKQVEAETPANWPLTSFSILFARYKGNLEQTVAGVQYLPQLQDGDRVLIAEGCTHHRQCNDIGSVKLPAWIQKATGKKLEFAFTSGREFPTDPRSYQLVVHCGGCMLNEQEMKNRQRICREKGVPITNYGILIAHLNGILERATQVFFQNKG